MLRIVAIGAALVILLPCTVLAVPTEVVFVEDPNCDPLFVPHVVDELGLSPPFPTDERIDAVATFTNLVACPMDDPEIPNALVVMTNLSPTAWKDVWYVADPAATTGGVGTTISNFDGFVDGFGPTFSPGHAFKIDTVGVNVPLVFESIAADGIFAIGETWHFIIDDYVNTGGLSPALFDSIGVASFSAGGPPSSGSIIAVPVPEPGTLIMLLVGCALLAIGSQARRVRAAAQAI